MKTCPACAKPVEAATIGGLCPECLLKVGLGSTAPQKNSRGFTPPSPEQLGDEFPQLEIEELLGSGGMGAVYEARQKNLDRVVALKILPPDIGQDSAFAERFQREARALAKLNHPNIVTLYEFGRTKNYCYFLMEFVDGMNLRQLMELNKLTPQEALIIVPQICHALQYAHDKGIVHRDIKPANILINRQGTVKVADFGLAKLIGLDTLDETAETRTATSGDTAAGQILGTPQYMAPEQRDHPSAVDHRADIYSLGVVLYQLLTGELPNAPIVPPSQKVQLDVRLDAVVLRALEKEPTRRYQQASEVRTQVETIADSTGGAPLPANAPAAHQPNYPPPLPPYNPAGQHDRKQTLIFCTVLFGAVAFIIYFAVFFERKSAVPEKPKLTQLPKIPSFPKPQEVSNATLPVDIDPEWKTPEYLLRVKKVQIESSIANLQARADAGQVDHSELQDAQDTVAILKARIERKVELVARLRVAMAMRQRSTARLKLNAGLLSQADFQTFENTVELRRTELDLIQKWMQETHPKWKPPVQKDLNVPAEKPPESAF